MAVMGSGAAGAVKYGSGYVLQHGRLISCLFFTVLLLIPRGWCPHGNKPGPKQSSGWRPLGLRAGAVGKCGAE